MKSDKAALAFGLILRTLRKKHLLSQEELGFEADMSRAHISQLELGERSPTFKTMLALSSALKIPLSQFVALVEEKLKED